MGVVVALFLRSSIVILEFENLQPHYHHLTHPPLSFIISTFTKQRVSSANLYPQKFRVLVKRPSFIIWAKNKTIDGVSLP